MLYWTIMITFFVSLAGLGIFIYFLKKGQFDESEEIKYQLFREENPDN